MSAYTIFRLASGFGLWIFLGILLTILMGPLGTTIALLMFMAVYTVNSYLRGRERRIGEAKFKEGIEKLFAKLDDEIQVIKLEEPNQKSTLTIREVKPNPERKN
jgi:hypothetical protein